MITKQKVLIVAFLVSLFFNLTLLTKLRLNGEVISAVEYAMDIHIGRGRIEQGMSIDDVINAMHHQPNDIVNTDEGVMMVGETSSTKMPLNDFLWPPISELGQINILVFFDFENRVLRTSVSEG